MGLLSNSQWNVTKLGARFSAELQEPLQPIAALPDAGAPQNPIPWGKKNTPQCTPLNTSKAGSCTRSSLCRMLSPAGKFRRTSLHHRAARMSVYDLPVCFFFFSLLDQPKGAIGMAFFASAHTSRVVNSSQASTSPLAGIRRTHVCGRLQEKALEDSSSAQRRAACLARGCKRGNKGHLALIRGELSWWAKHLKQLFLPTSTAGGRGLS